tara:strand:+ start:7546 stop:8829 length:1284 start_codon:yes stop_codon:yes gene_type:complete
MSTAQVLDTFDEGPYTEEDGSDIDSFDDSADDIADMEDYSNSENFDDEDEGSSAEETSVQAKEGEEVDPDSQVNLLEDQEEKGTPQKKEGSDPKDEKSEKSDEDGDAKSPEDDVAKDAGDGAEAIRNLKAFREGKAYEVPEDAQINVKINGKSEKVALKDLRDNYSGQVAYDKKFTELSEEKETFKVERDEYQTEIEELSGHMAGIRELVLAGQNGEGHPLAGFDKLLDLMNINSVEYRKQMQEQLLEENDIFNDMSDSEREAYWLRKEKDYLVNKQESERSKSSETVARQEQQAQITELREAHNVSENDFNSAYQDLQDAGTENISADLVIQTARLNPLMDIGEEIMSKYTEQLSTDEIDGMVREIAITMYNDPNYTQEDIASLIAEELEVETLVAEISKNKRPESIKHTTPKNNTNSYESFQDWE